MKYLVMNKGHVILRTDDRKEAREKVSSLDESAYIHYGPQARDEYVNKNEPHIGAKE